MCAHAHAHTHRPTRTGAHAQVFPHAHTHTHLHGSFQHAAMEYVGTTMCRWTPDVDRPSCTRNCFDCHDVRLLYAAGLDRRNILKQANTDEQPCTRAG